MHFLMSRIFSFLPRQEEMRISEFRFQIADLKTEDVARGYGAASPSPLPPFSLSDISHLTSLTVPLSPLISLPYPVSGAFKSEICNLKSEITFPL
jgi:hypothetical protein